MSLDEVLGELEASPAEAEEAEAPAADVPGWQTLAIDDDERVAGDFVCRVLARDGTFADAHGGVEWKHVAGYLRQVLARGSGDAAARARYLGCTFESHTELPPPPPPESGAPAAPPPPSRMTLLLRTADVPTDAEERPAGLACNEDALRMLHVRFDRACRDDPEAPFYPIPPEVAQQEAVISLLGHITTLLRFTCMSEEPAGWPALYTLCSRHYPGSEDKDAPVARKVAEVLRRARASIVQGFGSAPGTVLVPNKVEWASARRAEAPEEGFSVAPFRCEVCGGPHHASTAPTSRVVGEDGEPREIARHQHAYERELSGHCTIACMPVEACALPEEDQIALFGDTLGGDSSLSNVVETIVNHHFPARLMQDKSSFALISFCAGHVSRQHGLFRRADTRPEALPALYLFKNGVLKLSKAPDGGVREHWHDFARQGALPESFCEGKLVRGNLSRRRKDDGDAPMFLDHDFLVDRRLGPRCFRPGVEPRRMRAHLVARPLNLGNSFPFWPPREATEEEMEGIDGLGEWDTMVYDVVPPAVQHEALLAFDYNTRATLHGQHWAGCLAMLYSAVALMPLFAPGPALAVKLRRLVFRMGESRTGKSNSLKLLSYIPENKAMQVGEGRGNTQFSLEHIFDEARGRIVTGVLVWEEFTSERGGLTVSREALKMMSDAEAMIVLDRKNKKQQEVESSHAHFLVSNHPCPAESALFQRMTCFVFRRPVQDDLRDLDMNAVNDAGVSMLLASAAYGWARGCMQTINTMKPGHHASYQRAIDELSEMYLRSCEETPASRFIADLRAHGEVACEGGRRYRLSDRTNHVSIAELCEAINWHGAQVEGLKEQSGPKIVQTLQMCPTVRVASTARRVFGIERVPETEPPPAPRPLVTLLHAVRRDDRNRDEGGFARLLEVLARRDMAPEPPNPDLARACFVGGMVRALGDHGVPRGSVEALQEVYEIVEQEELPELGPVEPPHSRCDCDDPACRRVHTDDDDAQAAWAACLDPAAPGEVTVQEALDALMESRGGWGHRTQGPTSRALFEAQLRLLARLWPLKPACVGESLDDAVENYFRECQ